MVMKAERVIDVEGLDYDIVNRFLKDERLIGVLDKWVLSPDRELQVDLLEVRDKITAIQPVTLTGKLYRGFGLVGYQDTMGLTTGRFLPKLKSGLLNKPVLYEVKNPISFTTNPEIALAFGRNVVSTDAEFVRDHCIVFTDELSYAVSKSRRLKTPVTQDEVLILPSIKEITITLCKPPLPVSSIW